VKHLLTLALFLTFTSSFSQWTRVEQLPSSDIFNLYHKDNVLYAGGKNFIYFSPDKGETWDSTNTIPTFTSVNNIIVYKNELYATSFSKGVYKSTDAGNSWQNITAGIFPEVSDMVEWRGDLYATTLGASVFRLDPVTRDHWINFSNGLSGISANNTAIAGNSRALIAGTLANGLYDYLPVNSTAWQERFLLGQVRPTEGIYDIITAHDSLFLAGSTGRFYMSTDNGLNWNIFGDILGSLKSTIANAKQALIVSRITFDGARFNTFFHFIKKDALQGQFTHFSTELNHFTYKLDIHGDKLWDASANGLYFMSLSALAGISSPDESPTPITLPISFISFNTRCDGSKVLLTWKTAQEQNSDHYNVERSSDGTRWTVIGSLPATGSNAIESSYSFTDNNPVVNGYYRIVHIDKDGKVEYSSLIRSSCAVSDAISTWPNPVNNMANINIVSGNESVAIIRVFDSKGSLVRSQRTAISKGNNQFSVDMRSLVNGIYSISVEWNNGQTRKAIQVIRN
jgi:hypothetical protein